MAITQLETPVAVTRAAVYVRISEDKRGDEAGVDRQAEDGRALAASRGWSVVGMPYVDNDISASTGILRPAYRRLLADIRAGVVDAVIVWHTSRLWRNRRERAEGIEELRRAGVSVVAVRGPDLDMSTAYGRGMAGLVGEFDTMESEVKSERVLRALEQNATAGRPHGRRAYGWSRVYDPQTGRSHDEVNHDEAEVVREIARRILRGDSLRSIVLDLNARGIPSPAGKAWSKPSLRAVVLRERNAGLRVHQGEIVGEASWDAILDRGTWERACAVLSDPTRRTSTGSAAAHLLSGLATCAVCDGPIKAANNRGVPSYKCAEGSHVTRRREDVDDLVTRVVLARLARPDAVDLLAPDDRGHVEAAEEARALERLMDEAADDYSDRKISRRQLERITARVRPQLEDALSRARAIDDAPVLVDLVNAPDPAVVWHGEEGREGLPLSRRRAVVDALLRVSIAPAGQGARVFDPDAIRITWKGANQ